MRSKSNFFSKLRRFLSSALVISFTFVTAYWAGARVISDDATFSQKGGAISYLLFVLGIAGLVIVSFLRKQG